MHEQHPAAAIGPHIIFSNVVGLLLGDHACVDVTPSSWSTETAVAVALGNRNGVS